MIEGLYQSGIVPSWASLGRVIFASPLMSARLPIFASCRKMRSSCSSETSIEMAMLFFRDILHSDIDVLRQFVRDAVAAAGNGHRAELAAPVAETVLGKMASSPALRRICMRAYEIATSRPAPYQPYYQILRCLTGSSGREHSMVFHFDSYVLTLLVPIQVPRGKESGELIVLPNIDRSGAGM